MLILLSGKIRVLIVKGSLRAYEHSFFARNDGWGLNRSEESNENRQNFSSLTHACSLLILQPVARSSKKADFLRRFCCESGSGMFSIKVRTLLRLQCGSDMGELGLLTLIPRMRSDTSDDLLM